MEPKTSNNPESVVREIKRKTPGLLDFRKGYTLMSLEVTLYRGPLKIEYPFSFPYL
jgi:hypothetical protein